MAESSKGIFSRLAARLAASTAVFRQELSGLAAYGPIDDGFWEALEEVILGADVGPEVGLRLVADLRREAERLGMKHSKEAIGGMRQMLLGRLDWRPRALHSGARPEVYLVLGVNGTGKTTTAAKLANRFKVGGERVILGAADTFRAAAGEQLKHWADQIGCEIVSSEPGADPAAVAFSTVEAAVARGAAAAVIDTAGRLHTQTNLVEELRKIDRSVAKALPGAPHERLLVVDAALGLNSVVQAGVFHEALQLTGVVLTKLDGSSRGGVVLGLEERFGVPVKLVGTGEKLDDLETFDPRAYVDGLFDPGPQ